METIAIYRESTIRTYGFHLLEGVTLCRIDLAAHQLARWGRVMQEIADPGPSFRLVWAQAEGTNGFKFYALCDDKQKMHAAQFPGCGAEPEADDWTYHTMPVDLLFFQGPHFGDRYGILSFVQKTLAARQVPQLASVCSVATIHLVFPVGWGASAKDVLSHAFEIPMGK